MGTMIARVNTNRNRNHLETLEGRKGIVTTIKSMGVARGDGTMMEITVKVEVEVAEKIGTLTFL